MNRATNEENNSGEEAPAAIRVAPEYYRMPHDEQISKEWQDDNQIIIANKSAVQDTVKTR